jgi:superoxide dismutase, Cu-Zn family
MNRRKWLLIAAMAAVAFACGAAGKSAVANLEPKNNSSLTGSASFKTGEKGVSLKLNVAGFNAGKHAVHIHDKADCSSADGLSAGGHWNPTTDSHGEFGKEHFHLGDIGNFEVGEGGGGTVEMTTDKWTIGTGAANDVIGHSVIIHNGVDDFVSQPTGDAGSRAGCGVIGAGQ